MTSLNAKIRDIISAYKLSDRQFAIKIGVTQSVIGSMFQKGTEPSSKVIRNTLTAFPEISADWFLRDSGEMLKSQSKEIERINSLLDTITTLQQAINAKSDTIAALNERIKQLENQLNK
ncbi:XRE family transcriptional regulator [uncultured Muribaculum sp.]|uniref:XRE family transcriptional regulator n=1 Tax=uncultured Muribaculum sp. TaxID=1918613 RepID=UPI0025DA350C|nr:XRE family transcriptional regulator [uncultured Muribaculum sp.]